ncbi:MAG: hypothetical protein H8D45_13930 [Bacteroidetes bacterium]|nr:hypothetical protein [Bacteroidota bacterium]
MKKIHKVSILLAVLLFISQVGITQVISYPDSWGKQGFTLEQESKGGVSINFSITDFYLEDVDIKGEQMKTVKVAGIFLPNNEGAPDLPGTGRYIAIPQGASVSVKVIAIRTETMTNIDIAPAPRIPLDTDKGPLHYEEDSKIYSKNAFYPAENVKLSKQTKIRGVDVVMLGITPFQYNPVTRELIVYRDLQIEVTFNGGNGHVGEDRLRSRWWDPIIKDAVLNPDALPEISYNKKSSFSKTPDYEYIIITPNDPIFISWADSIKAFRTLQGIKTGVVTTTEIGGNTTTAIENYVNDAYNNWDIPPVAVLLLGDYGTSGNTIISPMWNSYCVSDNIYADVDSDDLPDIIFARMTAQNAIHLETMITKFLDNERTPPTNPDFYDHPITALGWQDDRWFQICSEVVGGFWNNVLGKQTVRINALGYPASNYNTGPWSTNPNTTTIMNYFGPSGLGYIPNTPQELGGFTGGNATMVNNAVNSGAFILQHRDHGGITGWGEPYYLSSDIDGLTNSDLVWVFSINCLTGKYNTSGECFAEKFHRYTYNGQNSGALGITAASEVSYSFVNDTYVWGMYDNMWPDFMPGEVTDPPSRGILPAFGNAAGKIFLQQSSWPYNPQHKVYTHHLFHHHGDAFSTVYSEIPQYLSVTHSPTLLAGATSFTVTANAGSLIALSVNGEIIGTANGTGAPVVITIPPQNVGDIMIVTVTKQNYYRYSSNVNVIPASGPHITYNSHVINDAAGNGNGLADFGEFIQLHTTLENVGSATAYNVNATLACIDSYVTLTDNFEAYGTINTGATKTINNAFGFSIADNIPDQYIIDFELQMTGNADDTWTSYFSILVNAPVLNIGNLTIDDSEMGNDDGKLDPGETVDIIIGTTNDGHSNSPSATGYLSSTSPYITVNSSSSPLGIINVGATSYATFNISVDGATPLGQSVDLIFDVIAGLYTNNYTFYESVGLIIEDWETGDFSKFPWEFSGDANFSVVTESPYEGAFCAKSGDISDSQTTSLYLTAYISSPGTISFYRKVSSENNYDYLRFYIDGSLQEQWSGTVAWGQVSYSVTAGEHTFEWMYYKDYSVSTGSDCGWVDYIIFPAMAPPPAPAEIEISPANFNVTLSQDNMTDELMQISNLGDLGLTYSTSVNYTDKSGWFNPNFKLGYTQENFTTSTKEEICPTQQVGYSYPEAVGDILMQFDIQTPTGDNQLLGCEFDGTYLWFTGGGNSGTNMLYKFDISGNLLNSYSQGTSSSWGMRDMAFDGTYLYAGDENGFYQINPATGSVTTLFSGNLGLGAIRALAYNPNTGHFYAANWDTQIIEFDASGTQHGTLTAPGLSQMYGFAYDETNNVLWIHNRAGNPETTFYEYSLNTQALTGVSIQVPWLTGLTGQINGGAFLSTDLITGKKVLGGVVQGDPVDTFFAMELGDLSSYTWLSITNNGSGTVPGSQSVNVTVHFDATGLDIGIYTGEVVVNSNDPDSPQVIVPCTLEVIGGITVNLTAFLEGPFAGSDMSTFLNMLGFIPLTQPYNTPPWNYNGTESVASIPNSDVIDWVLIELRETPGDASSATSSTMIDRQAAFVLKDGTIVKTNGSSPLVFNVEITENLFAVVYHRNHLGILSANPLPLSGGEYIYNFTTGEGQVYGGLNGHKELEPGIWGMMGGDGNADGEINNLDKNDIWNQQRGNTGYYSGDFNMNGQVENVDKSGTWKPNAGNCSHIVE